MQTQNCAYYMHFLVLKESEQKCAQWIETPLCIKEPKAIPKPNDLIWSDKHCLNFPESNTFYAPPLPPPFKRTKKADYIL